MYQIRFIKEDGKTTLIYFTPYYSESRYLDGLPSVEKIPYTHVEIWQDGECLRTEYRKH